MSKTVKDIVEYYKSLDLGSDDFDLFAIVRKVCDDGAIQESVKAIDRVDLDPEEKECLLVISPDKEPLKALHAIEEIGSINSDFELYSCYEISLDDGWARVKISIKGFEENADRRQFVVACGA